MCRFIKDKRTSTRKPLAVCAVVSRSYPACPHATTEPTHVVVCTCLTCERELNLNLDSNDQSMLSYVNNDWIDADTPCGQLNRCKNGVNGRLSWDAYAFRPPLPALSEDYLPPSIYINMCGAENRAGAALLHAGVAGYPGHNHSKV